MPITEQKPILFSYSCVNTEFNTERLTHGYFWNNLLIYLLFNIYLPERVAEKKKQQREKQAEGGAMCLLYVSHLGSEGPSIWVISTKTVIRELFYKMEQADHKPMPIWDASTSGNRSTGFATTLLLNSICFLFLRVKTQKQTLNLECVWIVLTKGEIKVLSLKDPFAEFWCTEPLWVLSSNELCFC